MKINEKVLIKKLHWDRYYDKISGFIRNDEYLFLINKNLCDEKISKSYLENHVKTGNIFSTWIHIHSPLSNKQKEFFKDVEYKQPIY